MSFLFITGMGRSGTTLLDKLLHNHHQAYIASQPFPLLFLQAKKDFYHTIKHPEDYYYFNNYFNEQHYTLPAFTSFLKQHQFGKQQLYSILNNADNYSGQFHHYPEAETLADRFKNSSLTSVSQGLLKWLSNFENNTALKLLGSKEIFCEEFIPYLIEQGWKVIVVIRDPRDVIVSMNFGKGSSFTGSIKPTLFNIRNWRKSVAFAATYHHHSNFMAVRYEDLVHDYKNTMNKLTNFLHCEAYNWDEVMRKGLINDHGVLWKANSSHQRYSFIDARSIGKYQEKLTSKQIEYIETFTLPELLLLGYETSISAADITPETMLKQQEPFHVTEERLKPPKFNIATETALEIERFGIISGTREASASAIEKLFISRSAYNALLNQFN